MSITMSISLNICSSSSSSPITHLRIWDACRSFNLIKIQTHRVSNLVLNLKLKREISWSHRNFNLFPIQATHATVLCLSDSKNYPAEHEGLMDDKDKQQERPLPTTKILEQLKRYGASGILSYGLLNTAYYLTTFLLVWFYIAPAPGKMGYIAAVSRFLKVMAMVWAGSQVTKLIRAAGALALAPLVDRGLSWFTVRYKFESRGKAFFTVVAFCLSLAIIMFLVVTLLWA